MVLSGSLHNCSHGDNENDILKKAVIILKKSLLSVHSVLESVDAGHWVQQRHVLGAVERQPLGAVVMHHLRDAGEHAAALVQGVAVLLGLGHHDVDAALACPGSYTGNTTPTPEPGNENQVSCTI